MTIDAAILMQIIDFMTTLLRKAFVRFIFLPTTPLFCLSAQDMGNETPRFDLNVDPPTPQYLFSRKVHFIN